MQLICKSEFERVNDSISDKYQRLEVIANMCRYNTLAAVKNAGSGHLGSSLSSMEILVWLYFNEMNIKKVDLSNPNRDIYFSSKGHDVPGQYAVLHALGILSDKQLLSLRRLNGLDGHPDVRIKGIEANSGSLGMGISKAKGMAWAKSHMKYNGHVYVLTGDGEFQEGQNYEALQSAFHQGITGFTVIMDHNKVQSDKYIDDIVSLGNLKEKIESFGWNVISIDGNSFSDIDGAFTIRKQKCKENFFIIANTIKGKGVSFMEHPNAMSLINGLYPWHAGAPDDNSFNKAIEEIEDKIQKQLGLLNIEPVKFTDFETIISSLPKEIHLNELGEPISQASTQLHVSKATSEYVVEAFGKALLNEGKFHPELIVLDADLASDCRLRNFEYNLPEQFIENGIAEQDMVSMAGGLARMGLLPVVNSFAAFLASRANEQIYNNATELTKIIYAFHYGGLIPAGPGKSHQSVRDISLIGAIPNIEIFQPCNSLEVEQILSYCVNFAKSNCVIRMNISPSPQRIELPQGYVFTAGCGVELTEGRDAVIFAYGPVMLNEALKASEILRNEGLGLKVINMSSLNRMDENWFEGQIADINKIYVLDDHSTVGGLGDFILSKMVKLNLIQGKHFEKFGIENYPACGTPPEVLSYHGLDGATLAKRIRNN